MNTILFDLDGTLLPMDFDMFMKLYFHNMSLHFGNKVDTKTLAKDIMKATEYMIKTNDDRTNYQLFMDCFDTLVEGNIEDYEALFDSYYDSGFAKVQASTYQSKAMLDSVKLLKEKGYKLVIATNPLFPLKANLHRIEWAGLDLSMFDHVTSLEENTFCKPFPQFYQEVLNVIGRQPEECMMVGNDIFDDLPAGTLGIKTYLVTDCLLNQRNLPNTADYTGSFDDFLTFTKSLPNLNKTT